MNTSVLIGAELWKYQRENKLTVPHQTSAGNIRQNWHFVVFCEGVETTFNITLCVNWMSFRTGFLFQLLLPIHAFIMTWQEPVATQTWDNIGSGNVFLPDDNKPLP